jgi:uncharacterized coiled-coil DUF342 family protein
MMSDSEALRERVDAVQRQAVELKQAVDQLREESSEQVKARIQQVKGISPPIRRRPAPRQGRLLTARKASGTR